MIFGTGIDTVSIARFERIIAARGDRFLRRIFSQGEIEESARRGRPAAFLAARFAAREALVKALGTGFIPGVALRDIAVINGERGKPELELSSRLSKMLKASGVARCHLSLSHDGDSAQAIVILETVSGAPEEGKGACS